jgi:hypothetical protein
MPNLSENAITSLHSANIEKKSSGIQTRPPVVGPEFGMTAVILGLPAECISNTQFVTCATRERLDMQNEHDIQLEHKTVGFINNQKR